MFLIRNEENRRIMEVTCESAASSLFPQINLHILLFIQGSWEYEIINPRYYWCEPILAFSTFCVTCTNPSFWLIWTLHSTKKMNKTFGVSVSRCPFQDFSRNQTGRMYSLTGSWKEHLVSTWSCFRKVVLSVTLIQCSARGMSSLGFTTLPPTVSNPRTSPSSTSASTASSILLTCLATKTWWVKLKATTSSPSAWNLQAATRTTNWLYSKQSGR